MEQTGNKALSWTKRIGYALIDEVEVEIGGQRVDKHYGVWMQIWSELTHSKEKSDCLDKMIDNSNKGTVSSKTYYVPLQFWFCKNPGCALPLIALQYHEVKINLTFKALNLLYRDLAPSPAELTTTPDMTTSLYVDYIYLDTDERRRFAQVSHEYLIEQLQFTGAEEATDRHTLNFNHPVKELVWITRNDAIISSNDYFNYNGSRKSSLQDAIQFSDKPAIAAKSTCADILTTLQNAVNGNNFTIDTSSLFSSGAHENPVTVTFKTALSGGDVADNNIEIRVDSDTAGAEHQGSVVKALMGVPDETNIKYPPSGPFIFKILAENGSANAVTITAENYGVQGNFTIITGQTGDTIGIGSGGVLSGGVDSTLTITTTSLVGNSGNKTIRFVDSIDDINQINISELAGGDYGTIYDVGLAVIDFINGTANALVRGDQAESAAHSGINGITAINGTVNGRITIIADSVGNLDSAVGISISADLTNTTLSGANLSGGSNGVNPTNKAKLQLNGHDRMSIRNGSYFNLVQPYQHHTGNPSLGINVYSFGLTPEEHQPSGTCNFSRIDNAQLQITRENNEPSQISIFAINYNVLRIMSGMGGLAYSN
jgi:hypothetical protein